MNRRSYKSLLKRLAIGIIFSVFIILLTVSSNFGKVTASGYLPITATPKISTSPTEPAFVSVTPTPIAPISVKVTISPDYFLDALTAAYVLLTLLLAVIAFRSLSKTQTSLELTREQIDINKLQSQEALGASERHSQAAIDAVNKQIAVSEQIAREALYNAHKPVIVPTSEFVSVGSRTDLFDFMMQNKGIGIAVNTCGAITSTDTGEFYRFDETHFLVPDKLEKISVISIKPILDFMFPDREFIGYSIYPQPDTNYKGTGIRLLVTYNDIFENKYLVIFDKSDLFGWRQIGEPKRIQQRLDEYLVEKRSRIEHEQQPTS